MALWRRKWIRLSALALVAFFSLAWWLLDSDFARGLAFARLRDELRAQGIALQGGELSYNLLGLTLTLKDITLRSVATPDLPPIAKIERAQLTFHWNTFSSRTLDLDRASLTGLDLHVVMDPDGRTNLPHSPPSQAEPAPWLIRQLLLTKANLEVSDLRDNASFRLTNWGLNLQGSPLTRRHQLTLVPTGTAELSYGSQTLRFPQVTLSGKLDPRSFTIDKLLLANAQSSLTIDGTAAFNGNLQLRADTNLDLPSLARFLGRPETIGGTLQAQAVASGELANLRIATQVTGSKITYDQLPPLNFSAAAEYRAAQGRIDLQSSTFESAAGTAYAQGFLGLQGDSEFTARIERVKLPAQLASRAVIALTARWPALRFQNAALSGRVQLIPTQPEPTANRLPVTAEIALSGNLSRLKVDLLSASAAGAEAFGTVYLTDRQKLDGTLTAGSNSLAKVLRQAKYAGPPVEGRAAAQVTLSGTIDSPLVAADLTVEDLGISTVKNANLYAHLTYQDQLVSLTGLNAKWKGQTLQADGTFHLSDHRLEGAARTEGVRLEKLVTGAASGPLQAEATITGTLEHPQAAIHLAGSGLRADSESLGNLEAQAVLEDTLLRVTQFQLPQLGLVATGTYRLSDGTYTLEATAPAMPLTYGRVALTAKGAGAVDNPQLEATLASPALTIAGQAYGPVKISASIQDHLARITGTATEYGVSAAGEVSTSAPYASTFTMEAANLPLQFDERLKGMVNAKANAQGDLERWQQGTASVVANLVDVTWNGQPVTLASPIEAQFANGLFNLKPLSLAAAGSTISAGGQLPLDPKSTAGSLQFQAQLDLASLPKLIPGQEQPFVATGIATLTGEARGNLQRLEPTATLTLRDATIIPKGLNPVSNLQLEAQLQEGRFTLDKLTGIWANAKISATGELPLGLLPRDLPIDFPRAPGLAKLAATLTGLDLSSIEGMPANASGTVSLRVEAESAKAEVASITAQVVADELRLRVGDIALEQVGKSAVSIADGNARIETLALSGPGTDLVLRGRAGLLGDFPIALRLAGSIETGVLSPLLAPAKLRGPARIQLTAYGPVAALKAAGFVELTDGQLILSQPRIAAENVFARINFTGEQVTVVRLDGQLNGGTVTAKGGFKIADGEPRDTDLSAEATNVYFDYPFGLRTLSNFGLRLKQSGQQFTLGGSVKIQEGSFRELVTIEGNLLSYLNRGAAEDTAGLERNPYLERTRFDVSLRTDSPLLVRNNLAKAGVNVDLKLAGNYYEPALLGRVTLEENGELYFSERSYTVDRGVITFTNERKIEPIFDILARTRVASHDVSLLIAGGGPEKISTTLTSDPALSEQDVLALLITGKSPEDYKNSDTGALASRQALSYFAGSFGSRFTNQLERATGLSTVRVEPDLIANESNPTARLTIGQDLSKNARLIYSMNLANGGDQIYIAEYDITKRFTTRGVKQIDNTYRFEFRHALRFGGIKPPERGKSQDQRRIGKVDVPTDSGIVEAKIRDAFKNKPGKRYDFFEIRKGVDRVEKLFSKEDRLEARVRLQRELKDQTVDLALDIQAGPRLNFVFEGWTPSGKLRRQVREIWRDGVFDAQRLDDVTRALSVALIEGGFLAARIDPKIRTSERKLVTFDIQTGAKYGTAALEFPGAKGIPAGELKGLLKRKDLQSALYLNGPKVRDRLQSYYREKGYLDAAVKLPVPVFANGKATVRIPILEGPRYRVAAVKFSGNSALTDEVLVQKSELKVDAPYELPLRQVSVDQLRDLYLAAGYHDARVETAVKRTADKVEVTYRVTEGPKEIVQGIEVSGNDATSEKLVRSQISLKVGDALEPAKLAESRRNLYSTGAYSLVDLERAPAGDLSTAGVRPMLLRARVREVQPFDLRYGAYFDTDRGPGAVIDFTNRNSLGSARAIGGRLRYDGDFREGRVFFSQPLLRRFPLQSIFSAYINRTLLPTFITDRVGVSVQQETRFKRRYIINYGYRFERVHTFDKIQDDFLPFDITLRVAPLTFTVNRESRDDILDATQGSFLSHAFQWAPELLGSDVRFVRYYAQYFKYFALSKPTEIPLSGGVKKPRLVYAGAARLGLAKGLGGQNLVASERFFAGGGTTLRGFAQNTLGPKDFLGDPTGGNAVLLLNNELRFPMASIFDGVGFVDIGNTYRKATDFSFGDLRKAAGMGLRIRTPYFLIRLDYGFKLDRRLGESRGGFFFSIGQAF